MSKDVFISYKSEEYEDAVWLCEELNNVGISTWMAPRDIPSGSSYAREITTAIKGCKVFVLVLSPAAQTSQWIPKEIDNAINENKLILPFMVKQCELNDEFKFFLSNIQFKEAYKNRNKALAELITEIKEYLQKLPFEKKEDSAKIIMITPPKASTSQAAVQKNTAPHTVKPNASDTKKIGRKKKKHGILKSRKILIIPMLIVLLIEIIFLISTSNTIGIARIPFKKNDGFVKLENVSITENDFENIAEFKSLYSLSFINCTITPSSLEFPDLEHLISLEFTNCNLTQKQLDSIDFSKMPKLSGLILKDNKSISNISSYNTIKQNIEELDISGTSVKDISFVSGTEKLRIFKANELGLNSLSSLRECLYLEEIEAAVNNLTSTEGLENCTQLRRAILSANEIEDISILSKSVKTLTEVQIAFNKIADISCLKDCTNLNIFTADGNEISSLSPISGNKQLEFLSVSDNNLSDLGGIKTESLCYIDISDNLFSGELKLTLPENREIQLFAQNNKFTSVNITKGSMYKEIDLSGNPLACVDGLKNFEYLLLLTLDFSDNTDYKDLGTSTTDFVIINCPLDKRVPVEKAINGNVKFEERPTESRENTAA